MYQDFYEEDTKAKDNSEFSAEHKKMLADDEARLATLPTTVEQTQPEPTAQPGQPAQAQPEEPKDQSFPWEAGYDLGDAARNFAEISLAPATGLVDFGTDLINMIPQEYRDFRADVLKQHDVDGESLRNPSDSKKVEMDSDSRFGKNLKEKGAKKLLEVAFSHPIKLIANALGVPPHWMLEMGKANNVKVAALLGAKEHAIKQVQAGVDVLVVSGTEGGGHCGSVSTMVLIPEVKRAIKDLGDVPILAAGGIATGEQMAGIMTMGADGVWCASVFLPTTEAETSENIKEKMIQATSSQTVRSKSRTGKHSRQLQSAWTDAWESKDAPEPLPMPLQTMVSEPALSIVKDKAAIGHEGAKKLETYWVGQGIGLVNESITAGQTVQKFKEEFIEAYENINNLFD